MLNINESLSELILSLYNEYKAELIEVFTNNNEFTILRRTDENI
jgi:hypothetical protein